MGGALLPPYLYLERHGVALRSYRIPVRGLPPSFEGFTILHLSDLHEKEFGRGQCELISLLKGKHFDLVALTGDLVTGYRPDLTPALELIAALACISEAPIYCVLGNHDWRVMLGGDLTDKLSRAGGKVLSNTSVTVSRGGERLSVIGVDDPVTKRARLTEALTGVDPATRACFSPTPPTPTKKRCRKVLTSCWPDTPTVGSCASRS
jgi:predicted MPP superfamily phosphohydrolase